MNGLGAEGHRPGREVGKYWEMNDGYWSFQVFVDNNIECHQPHALGTKCQAVIISENVI